MLVVGNACRRQTYRWDQIYRNPVGSAGGPKIVLDTARPYVGNGYV